MIDAMNRSVNPRKAVALGEQIEDAARVGHEVLAAQRPDIGRHRILVAEHQYGQPLMVFVQRRNGCRAWTQERQTPDVEGSALRWSAREQALDSRAIRADETLAGMFGIGEARFKQQ